MVDKSMPTEKASEILKGEVGDKPKPPVDRTVRLEGWFPINPKVPSKQKGKGKDDEEATWPDMGDVYLKDRMFLYGIREIKNALGTLSVLPECVRHAVKYAGPFYAPVEVRAVVDVKAEGNPMPFWIETEKAVKLAKMIDDYQKQLSEYEGDASTVFLCDKIEQHENTELTLQED